MKFCFKAGQQQKLLKWCMQPVEMKQEHDVTFFAGMDSFVKGRKVLKMMP